MVIPSDDAIIKRRLLLEGESGLDDKRLALLLKDFLKWSSEDDSSDIRYLSYSSARISAGAYQSMVEKIVQCENAMEQALLIQIMNIEQSNRKINKMKRELSDLENINKKCDEKINLRKKQFHLFLVALHDLKKIVDQDGLLIDSSDHVTADLEETMDVS
ncbi:unnamed protein product [Mesocestoides corti]|uniref:THO complex subunit 7 homolog n=1 Tax=Mesocestoides corti TaxID=53468 RepID=A0A0R3U395_MESCO|nr:unnamed protein product [Mesocestoides corti]